MTGKQTLLVKKPNSEVVEETDGKARPGSRRKKPSITEGSSLNFKDSSAPSRDLSDDDLQAYLL
tara:strand:- start:7680 stop:7871 length:192 start_codon:yes stop_codon:yes gene_type:complete